MFHPVYWPNSSIKTTEERQQALRALVYLLLLRKNFSMI